MILREGLGCIQQQEEYVWVSQLWHRLVLGASMRVIV